jgi:hypothetical protein
LTPARSFRDEWTPCGMLAECLLWPSPLWDERIQSESAQGHARSVGMISSPSPAAAPEVQYKTAVGSNTELLNSQKR